MIVQSNEQLQVMDLHVNGQTHTVVMRSADTLLYVLRTQLGLTGAKPGCENGDCGACTVIVDDDVMHSCLILGMEAVGKSVLTSEGILHSPWQQSFVDHWAIQCGYCTPGLLMTCYALQNHHPDANDEQITEWLQSNICRCTGYQEIKDAVRSVLHAPLI